MTVGITYVGIDAHKSQLVVAMLLPRSRKAEIWQVANTEKEVRKLVRRLKKSAPGEVRACYEAGPLGYGLKRTLEKSEIICEVVAPSLIPVKPGCRVKTDRRDAEKLASLLRAELLTEVAAPAPQEESVRDLCRLRLRVKEDLTKVRNRIGKFLLRREIYRSPHTNWSRPHRQWLNGLSFDLEADRLIFADHLRALEQLEDRVKALDEHIARIAEEEPYAKPVGWLRCFRGIDTLTAMVLVTELHGFARFETARALMSYLGLTVSEYSSGEKTRRGSITKAGNNFLRRLLVESAQHCRRAPRTSARLRIRRQGQPADVVAIADRAQHRLHRRYWSLTNAGKETNKVKVACARELVGFVWAVLYPRTLAMHEDGQRKTA